MTDRLTPPLRAADIRQRMTRIIATESSPQTAADRCIAVLAAFLRERAAGPGIMEFRTATAIPLAKLAKELEAVVTPPDPEGGPT